MKKKKGGGGGGGGGLKKDHKSVQKGKDAVPVQCAWLHAKWSSLYFCFIIVMKNSFICFFLCWSTVELANPYADPTAHPYAPDCYV